MLRHCSLRVPEDPFDLGEDLGVVEVGPGDPPAGQAATHVPHPLQSAVITRLASFASSNSMALYGQMVLQILQPEQASSLIKATIGSMITSPLVIMP